MKKRFLLLSLLASLSLSGCDALDKFFDGNVSKDETKEETPQNKNNEEQNNSEQEENPDNTEQPTNPDNPVTPTMPTLPESVEEYYKNISVNATGSTLKTQLCTLISGHTKYDYDNLEIAMKTTDRNWEKSPDPNDENPYINLLYTVNNDDKASKWNTYHGGGGILDFNSAHWNKEHIWAKANGFNSKGAPAYSDLHHIRASDTKNNNKRNNYAFANNSGEYVADFNGDNSGKFEDSNPKTYEPIDRDKGDVARALFYMATRYMNGDGSTGTHLTLTTGKDASGGKWGYLNTLLAWHTQDPPDEWEINRNGLVQNIQGNRNPYIDYPEWAQKVFG